MAPVAATALPIRFVRGFWLAGFVSLLVMVVLWNAGYIISSMHNIDPALAEKAVGYLRALLWGAPGYLFFQVAP
ncbi:Multidrug-efflux transporter [Raoultella planticola]|uniref:Multidrug-efflux transporter n=1 Tax=Raoultella planticola TaxID=575 RepID=A0A485CYN1_RAOPL|nr:Multidrug-efflux transporter [Raoultella planticola]